MPADTDLVLFSYFMEDMIPFEQKFVEFFKLLVREVNPGTLFVGVRLLLSPPLFHVCHDSKRAMSVCKGHVILPGVWGPAAWMGAFCPSPVACRHWLRDFGETSHNPWGPLGCC